MGSETNTIRSTSLIITSRPRFKPFSWPEALISFSRPRLGVLSWPAASSYVMPGPGQASHLYLYLKASNAIVGFPLLSKAHFE